MNSNVNIPEGFVRVQRGVVGIGDTVISSHYGKAVVKEIQGCGKFCQSTTIAECDDHMVQFVFESPYSDHVRSERYSRRGTILRKKAV